MSGVDKRSANALRRVLQQMPKEMTAEIKVAVKESAEELLDAIEEGARFHRRTGNLEEQAGISIKSNGFRADVGYPGKRKQKKAFYARFIEYGTKDRPASPFMRDALQRKKNKIADRLDKAVDKALAAFTRG